MFQSKHLQQNTVHPVWKQHMSTENKVSFWRKASLCEQWTPPRHTHTQVSNTVPLSRCVSGAVFCCFFEGASLPKPMAPWSITCSLSHSTSHSYKFLAIVMTECATCPKGHPASRPTLVLQFCPPPQCKRWLEYQALSLLASLLVQTLYFLEHFQRRGFYLASQLWRLSPASGNWNIPQCLWG